MAHLGVIYRRTIGIGKILTTGFVAGKTREYGKSYSMLFNLFIQDPDFEWLMIDASYIKVHPHATGAVGGNQAMWHIKGGSTRKYILQ